MDTAGKHKLRKRRIIGALIAALALCVPLTGCTYGGEKGSSSGERTALMKEPPKMKVITDKESSVVGWSGCQWDYRKGSGSEGFVADAVGLGNDKFREGLKFLKVENGPVVLEFDPKPESISAGIAGAADIQAAGISAIKDVEVNQDNAINIPEGSWYLEVNAVWDKANGSGGDATYFFAVSRESSAKEGGTSVTLNAQDKYSYYKQDYMTQVIPREYEYAGLLSKEQAGGTDAEGCPYYTLKNDKGANGFAIYVYMPTAVCRQKVIDGKEAYVMSAGYAFVPWTATAPDDPRVSGNKVMTLADVRRLSATVRNGLSWDNLKDYISTMPYSGRYCRHYFLAGCDFCFTAEGSPDVNGDRGSISDALLIHNDPYDSVDIRSGDVLAFIEKYSGNISGSPYGDLPDKYPDLFGLDIRDGLTVYVYQMAADDYHCGLLQGKAEYIDSAVLMGKDAVHISIDEMKQVLAVYNLPDDMIRLCYVTNPLSSYAVPAETALSELKYRFDSRYETTILGIKFPGMIENVPEEDEAAGKK